MEDPVFQYAARANADAIRRQLEAEQSMPRAVQQALPQSSAPSVSKGGMQVNEEDAPLYPEIETTKQYELHRRERAKAIARANAILTGPEFAGAPGHIIETRRKAYESMIDAKYPELKPFDDSAPAKEIMSELSSFRKKDEMIRNIKYELDAASKLTDKQEKSARLQTIIPKLVQSTGTGGADALQPAEVVMGQPEMINYLKWARSVGSDPSSPLTLAAFFTDPQVKAGQFIENDPDNYIKKIKGVYNTFVSTRNDTLKQFEDRSSPNWLRRNTGLKPFKMFDDADNISAQTPLSAATRAAVEGAPSQISPQQTAPMAPAKQRIKFVYDAKGNLVPQ